MGEPQKTAGAPWTVSCQLCRVAQTQPCPRAVNRTYCVTVLGGLTFIPLRVHWNDQAEAGCQVTLNITEARELAQ